MSGQKAEKVLISGYGAKPGGHRQADPKQIRSQEWK